MARLRLVTLGITALIAAACGPGGGAGSAAPTGGSASVAPSTAADTAAPTADACAAGTLETKTDGELTVGTDNPAFPPYFEGTDNNTEPWDPEWGDPNTGKGFESAMAYAIAEQMGFTRDAVTWIPIAFNTSYAPGPKDFDFFIGQVTHNPERAASADLSEGYFFGNQTVVTMADSEFADATTITELKAAELGAQIGTTSLQTIEEVIETTAEAAVYNNTDDALEAMQNGQIDGVVVDLPTAGFITTVQVEGSKIVGQIGLEAGAQPEHFSLVLEKDSALTACVNQAIAALEVDGTLDVLSDEWLPFNSAPELLP
jgi:polar amino acid transport system substrate-binding protein